MSTVNEIIEYVHMCMLDYIEHKKILFPSDSKRRMMTIMK